MALVWNQAELSKNAQDALALAVRRTKVKNDTSIGSEDLVEALFQVTTIWSLVVSIKFTPCYFEGTALPFFFVHCASLEKSMC